MRSAPVGDASRTIPSLSLGLLGTAQPERAPELTTGTAPHPTLVLSGHLQAAKCSSSQSAAGASAVREPLAPASVACEGDVWGPGVWAQACCAAWRGLSHPHCGTHSTATARSTSGACCEGTNPGPPRACPLPTQALGTPEGLLQKGGERAGRQLVQTPPCAGTPKSHHSEEQGGQGPESQGTHSGNPPPQALHFGETPPACLWDRPLGGLPRLSSQQAPPARRSPRGLTQHALTSSCGPGAGVQARGAWPSALQRCALASGGRRTPHPTLCLPVTWPPSRVGSKVPAYPDPCHAGSGPTPMTSLYLDCTCRGCVHAAVLTDGWVGGCRTKTRLLGAHNSPHDNGGREQTLVPQ